MSGGGHAEPAGGGTQLDGIEALVVTVSDGVAAGTREDTSGAALEERLRTLGFDVRRAFVADEPEQVASAATAAVAAGTRLIVTTGGTGLGPRDRTPEAVTSMADYVVPGFGEAMRAEGRRTTPLADLSRSLAAVRGQTLILCLPGSRRAATESFDAVVGLLAHALETLAGQTSHSAAPDARGDRPTPRAAHDTPAGRPTPGA
jgi:molybdenum cofactor biosynthesis protein B